MQSQHDMYKCVIINHHLANKLTKVNIGNITHARAKANIFDRWRFFFKKTSIYIYKNSSPREYQLHSVIYTYILYIE